MGDLHPNRRHQIVPKSLPNDTKKITHLILEKCRSTAVFDLDKQGQVSHPNRPPKGHPILWSKRVPISNELPMSDIDTHSSLFNDGSQ